MKAERELKSELVAHAIYRMDESTRMIKRSLREINEEELWRPPNESLNSIANLLLHLCGNIRQYAIASLGQKEDTRKRDQEFSVKAGFTKAELLQQLESTVEEAKTVFRSVSQDELLRIRSVQGFEFSGTGILMHVVEHYSYHTGQIAFWVKLIKNKDLGFYENVDLDVKNKN